MNISRQRRDRCSEVPAWFEGPQALRKERFMTHLFHANAFTGPRAAGNATCVVIADSEYSDSECHAIARRLGAPDTAFVYPGRDPATRSVRFYSPREGEMAFCGQGLIAVDAILGRIKAMPDATTFTLETRTGPVVTRRDPNRSDVSWFDVPRERVQRCDALLSPAMLSARLSEAGPSPVVDSGRRRLFHQFHDVDSLYALSLPSEGVMEFCRTNELTGLCFYAMTGRNRIALRVFTISLAGGEDASTGGAVLGLSALAPEGKWSIDQGSGDVRSRGFLLLDSSSMRRDLSVGGAVEIVGEGDGADQSPGK